MIGNFLQLFRLLHCLAYLRILGFDGCISGGMGINYHTHTHTKQFLSVRKISVAGRPLATILSRVSLSTASLAVFIGSLNCCVRVYDVVTLEVQMSWLDRWDGQWRPPHIHKNSSLL